MSEVHRFVGFAVVGLFALGWLWGLAAKLVRRDPGEWFWRWLAAVQVVTGGQAVIGTALFALGRRQQLLHYAYGLFPLLVLAIAHAVARRYQGEPWVPFAWAAFFSFGLTLRALTTGLGLG